MPPSPLSPPHAVRLCLLGPLELTRPDGTSLASILAQPKRLALLAYLALGSGGGFLRRDVLLSLFWPEYDEERARSALRKALYFLRQALGEGVIIARGDEELALDPDRIWCDALAFQAAAGADRPEDAIDLYRGDLLPGFFLPDAGEFEHWLEAHRFRLKLQAAQTAAALSARAEASGDLEEAVRHAQQALALDAPSEPALRRLVELLHRSGDRAGVARAYEVWKRRLEEEYGVEPSAETQQRIAELLAAEGATPEAARQRAGPSPAARLESLAPVPTAAPANTSAPPAFGTARRPRRVHAWAGALVLAAVLVSAPVFVGKMTALNRERVFVAVLDNQTGDPALDPLGRMAADWIARGLMETGTLEVISPTSALYAVREAEPLAIRALARQAGAGTVVAGAYYRDGGLVGFQVQVIEVPSGRVLHTLEPVSTRADSATTGAEVLRQRVAAVLAARFDWPQELREITGRARPPTYAAYAEFVEGMALFHSRGQYLRAIERFERAWALDSTFYLPRLWTALMYSNLGKLPQMDSVLRSVALHRDRLTSYDRVLLEHFQALLAGDNETALRTTRHMNHLAPGSLLAGQAVFGVWTNRPREAVEALRQLDLERGILRSWNYYWYYLTTARHMLGEHRRELQEARQGRIQQPELLSALFTEVRALAALGRIEEVERLLHESLSVSPQPEWTPAEVMRNAAAELRAHGQAKAAARALDQALAWYRTRPEAERQEGHRPALAQTLYAAERWADARALFEELAAEQPENVHYLGHLGTLAARRGERREAERIAAALAPSTQPYLRGAHTLWRARIAAQLGDREQALLLLREALAQGQPYGLWLHTDLDLDPLRHQRAFRELLRPKG
jgi:DNA-binding SARP family transcriptional activator/tetratricopeptide (TPR) repeat protein/TolB-like protein